MKYTVYVVMKDGSMKTYAANRIDFNYHCGIEFFDAVDSTPTRIDASQAVLVEVFINKEK